MPNREKCITEKGKMSELVYKFFSSLQRLFDVCSGQCMRNKPGLVGRRWKINAPFEHEVKKFIESLNIGSRRASEINDLFFAEMNADHGTKLVDRSEERRVGKGEDIGGRLMTKKTRDVHVGAS